MERERSPEIHEVFIRILNRDRTIYPFLIGQIAYRAFVFPVSAGVYINNKIAEQFER